jgi:outer membrane protein assembly factor BamB
MKYLLRFQTILLLILALQSFAQTQQKITWPSLADSPWPVARGDVQGTGRSEYVGPKNPEVIWRKTYQYGVFASMVMDEEKNLLFGTRAVNSEANENYFYKVDSTGNQLWRFTTNFFNANSCAQAVSKNGTIYFGSQSGSFNAIDTEGNLLWTYQSSASFFNLNIILDREGNIYVGNADSLFCFKVDGEVKFKLAIPTIGYGLAFSPSGETIYVPSHYYDEAMGQFFYNLSAINTDGSIDWKLSLNRIVRQTPLIDNNGNIYIKESEQLLCIEPNGEIKWSYKIGGRDGGITMDTQGNIFLVGQNYDNGGVLSLDYHGNYRWYYEFDDYLPYWPHYEDVYHGLVCDADGSIYFGSTWGNYFYALNNDGDLMWRVALDSLYADSCPVISNDGTIYIGTHLGANNSNVENNLFAIKDKPNSVEDEETPTKFALYQNYPNPFNPTTTIKFSVPNVGTTHELSLRVYDILGREVQTLLHKPMQPGSYEVEFDESNLTSGVYFYVLETGGKRLSKKMLLVK